MEGVTYTDSSTLNEGEPQGLDAIAGVDPSSSVISAAAGNPALVEIRFVTPSGAREHTFVAKRSLIEAYFPGLGGSVPPSTDDVTKVFFHEIRIPWLDSKALSPTLAWSGKLAEEAYQYYDHYLTTSGKFPSFKDAVMHTTSLKDVPDATDYELKLFRNDTIEDVNHLLELLAVTRYICNRSGPCHDFGVLALANIFDSKPIDEVLRLLRLDGKECELTPEEMEKIIEQNAYMFDSWLTPPAPPSSSSEQTSSSVSETGAPKQVVDLPIVELD